MIDRETLSMRKIFITYLLLSLFNLIYATNFFLDKDATGLSNGTSWGNAWITTAQINWSQFQVGDTLFISGGVYPQWTISGKTGTGGYRYIVGAYHTGHSDEVIFRNTSNSTPTIFFGWDASSNIWMENITVESPIGTSDNMNAIKVAYGDNIVFNKMYVHTCLASNRVSHGFNLAESKNIEINNSTIISDSNTVSREQDGIIVGNANEGYFKFNNNKIILAGWTSTENPHRDGIQFWTNKTSAANINVTVSNTFIIDNVNTTKRSMGGFYAYGVTGKFNIYNNVIRLRGYEYTSAISIQAGSFTNQNLVANIYNNTILVDNQQYPLEAVGCDTVRAKNNIVLRTSSTFYLAWELSNCGYKDIDFNQYYAPAGNSNSFRVNGSEKSFSYWQSTLGYDVNGEWNPATFTNINGKNITDYKLLPNSHGIDEGNNISIFNDDIEGISRPQGGIWDRGVFEYTGSNPDVTSPELSSAEVVDSVTVILVFSEALEDSSAQNKSNYSINNGVIVNNAILSAIDGKKVTLNTTQNIPNTTYTLIVSNVKDLSGNTISSEHNILEYEYVINSSNNLVKQQIVHAMSNAWYQNYTPEKSIDGQGISNPGSRWGGAFPMPDTISYDLGYSKQISQTKISFYNWDAGREYRYKMLVSEDGANWFTALSEIWSEATEWNTENFESINARFIRLISLENNQSVYAGVWEFEIWGDNQTLDTGSETISPISFELFQNYPNPFNPSTKIKVQLPQNTQMRLLVYNMLGELVNEVANGEYQAGVNEFSFDATGLASGVYVYRIESPDFIDTKKMILLR